MLMESEGQKQTDQGTTESKEAGASLSRRDFLRLAGVAGATVGLGAGLGGLVAACGGSTTTTTTTAGPTTTAAQSTTTTAASSTTVTSAAATGREVKVGLVIPLTGIYALFGVADKWGLGLISKYIGDNMVLGDGQSHKVTWESVDTQSDVNRASQVTSDLILNSKVDLLAVGGGPDTVDPSADMAETLGAPFISCNNLWEAFIFGRKATPATEFKWTFGSLLGVDQCVQASLQVVNKISTNKVAGLYEANDVDGQAWLTAGEGYPDVFKKAGYKVVFPGPYNPGTEDYTSLISAYKSAGCEAHLGGNPGIDFPNFWKQALQQSYHPKVAIEIVAISTYEDMKALGPIVVGLTLGYTWHKDWPFTDPISGMTNAQLADDYEASQNTMWSNMITGYARFGWAVDVLKRTQNIDDKNSIVTAIKGSKLDLITGPIDFTAPVDITGLHVTANVCKQVLCLGQVVKSTGGKWLYDAPLVAAIDAPSSVTTIAPVPIVYS